MYLYPVIIKHISLLTRYSTHVLKLICTTLSFISLASYSPFYYLSPVQVGPGLDKGHRYDRSIGPGPGYRYEDGPDIVQVCLCRVRLLGWLSRSSAENFFDNFFLRFRKK